jgi:hypothetical protein
MDTKIQNTEKIEEAKSSQDSVKDGTAVGFALLGCLVAGTIGIFKAVVSEGVGSAACILASVVAFGTVCYFYFHKD